MSYEKIYIWDSMHTTAPHIQSLIFPSLNSSNFSNFTFSWCWCCRVCDWGSQKILFLLLHLSSCVRNPIHALWSFYSTYIKKLEYFFFFLLLFLLAANATTCYHSFSLFSLSFFLWLFLGIFFHPTAAAAVACQKGFMWEKENNHLEDLN